jgi:hypothetical protein
MGRACSEPKVARRNADKEEHLRCSVKERKMMSKKTTVCGLLLAALFAIANAALAVTPEDGWWWNPAEPGRGFNIETQNGTVFVATFIYDNSGQPIWYSGSGMLNNGILNATLMRSDSGQCVGCPYQAPNTNAQGDIAIEFHSPLQATVNWQGAIIPIERFNFALGGGVHQLLGIWTIALTSPPGSMGLSDEVAYVEVREGTALGIRASDPRAPVAAIALEGGEAYLSLSSLPENKTLVFLFWFEGINRLWGVTASVSADASPAEMENALINAGVPTAGFRTLSLAELDAQIANSSSVMQAPASVNSPDLPSMIQKLKALSSLIDIEEFKLK